MKYRRKPIVVEAFKWTGDIKQKEDPEWIVKAIKYGTVWFRYEGTPNVMMAISTQEGIMYASRGDYIIKDIKGVIFACGPDIFNSNYEEV